MSEEPARVLGDNELKLAAAAITAAVSPPLGFALAAGAALRSPTVREKLRGGAVRLLAQAMDTREHLEAKAAAEREQDVPVPSEPTTATNEGRR